jgi:hypothetical protein
MLPAWPPPPDLASIQELVRVADIEALIATGAPPDEYDPEASAILAGIRHLSSDQITAPNLRPIIEAIWSKAFAVDDVLPVARQFAILGLARQIERFFGPEADPQVRSK